jgi:hypothetical protein
MNRRQFVGTLTAGAAAVALGGSALVLEGCTAEATINKVLALLPTVSGIANTIGGVISAVDPALSLPITMALGAITAAFAIVKGILTQYESNLGSAPQTVLQTLDNAIASVESQIASIEALFPNLSAVVKAGIEIGLSAFQTILGFIASLIPAPVAQSMFPRASAALNANHVALAFGVAVTVPSHKEWARTYNSRMTASGWRDKKCHLSVPLF